MRAASLLKGLVVDAENPPLVVSHACKGKLRCAIMSVVRCSTSRVGDQAGIRVPAPELEMAVCEGLAAEVSMPLALLDKVGLQPTPD